MNTKLKEALASVALVLLLVISCTIDPAGTKPATIEAKTTEAETTTVREVETEEATTVKDEAEAVDKEVDKVEAVEPLDPVEVELLGRTIWGEAGGIPSTAERAAVAWCILNRVDVYDKTIEEIVTAPRQFQGYRPAGECPQEHLDLAADVLARWKAEKNGAEDVGRVLPSDYLYFLGDGERNHFSKEFQQDAALNIAGTDWTASCFWTWSLPDPYIQ